MIATAIRTDSWNVIILLFLNHHWTVTYKYDTFVEGIDADFIIMEKDNEEVLFGWDNWYEGEVQCTEERMKWIEEMVPYQFTYGDPANLKPGVVSLYRKWKEENLFNNPGLLQKR